MGVLDKLRRVLFDEDEVEVEVTNDELPTKPKKQPKKVGFKDYHQEEETDTIKEVVVPKEEPIEEVPVEPAEDTKEMPPLRTTFPDEDFEPRPPREEFGLRSHKYAEQPINQPEPVEREVRPKTPTPPIQHKEEPSSLSPEEFNRKYRVEPLKPKNHEEKDYHKYLGDDRAKGGKKPFKVTPVISPVYGILDENYIPAEVVNKADLNPSQREGRKKKEEKKTTLKEDLVELNTTINEMINDSIEEPIKEEQPIVEEEVVNEVVVETPPVEVEVETKTPVVEAEPVVEVVEDEPEIDIEDAFEPTNEYSTIEEEQPTIEEDEEPAPEEQEPTISLDELIKSNSMAEDEDEEEEGLNNTIETDLYNLINSMYKDDDEEEE